MLTLKLFSQKKHLYIHSIITTSAFTRFNPNRPLDLRLTELKARGKAQLGVRKTNAVAPCVSTKVATAFIVTSQKSNATHVHYGNRIINRLMSSLPMLPAMHVAALFA